MNILGWNVHSLNSGIWLKDLWIINDNNVGIIGLCETRVRPKNKVKVFQHFPGCWNLETNCEFSPKGRIWFLWNSNLWTVHFIHKLDQEISAMCSTSLGNSVVVSVIYGANSEAERRNLWSSVQNISNSIADAWLLLGDFNVVKKIHEKRGGRPIPVSCITEFNNCLEDCGLSDLRVEGGYWSLSNLSH